MMGLNVYLCEEENNLRNNMVTEINRAVTMNNVGKAIINKDHACCTAGLIIILPPSANERQY